jgi:HPt (histidine-containing phosphotransfer) domain-containing protein
MGGAVFAARVPAVLRPQALTWRKADKAMQSARPCQPAVNGSRAVCPRGKESDAMIDHDRLSSLRADIGEADFAEVIHLFVAEIGERLAALRADPGAARAEDFHFLRGSAASLGFTGMVTACQDAEIACLAGQQPDICAVAAGFDAALAAVAPDLPGLVAAA